jgi:hypothetical protein
MSLPITYYRSFSNGTFLPPIEDFPEEVTQGPQLVGEKIVEEFMNINAKFIGGHGVPLVWQDFTKEFDILIKNVCL